MFEVGLGLQSLVLLFSEMLGPVGLLTADQKWNFPCLLSFLCPVSSISFCATGCWVPQPDGTGTQRHTLGEPLVLLGSLLQHAMAEIATCLINNHSLIRPH